MAAHDFDLHQFLPYLLNRAAEAASAEFATRYRSEYGMTRTQWRVMAHLAQDGRMPAARICRLSHLDKTKVSRAVAIMEAQGWLARSPAPHDRRIDELALTRAGRRVHARLAQRALDHQQALADRLGADRLAALSAMLRDLARPAAEGSSPAAAGANAGDRSPPGR